MRGSRVVILFALLIAQGSPVSSSADDPLLLWGIKVHIGSHVIEIPSVATSARQIGAATVLRRTEAAKDGTFVCRVGGRWTSKRSGPGTSPHRNDAECVLFVNLQTGEYERFTGQQPAPDFVVQSPSGKYFALGSSVGWRLTPQLRDSLLRPSSGLGVNSAGLRTAEANARLSESLVGSVLFSIWKSDELMPIWNLRYPDESNSVESIRCSRPWNDGGAVPIPWWAIDSEPVVHNDPKMAFSPDEQYFVAITPELGVVVVNLLRGTQLSDLSIDGHRIPISFVFDTSSTIFVLWSDATFSQMRLADGAILAAGSLPDERYPISAGKGTERKHAMFSSCSVTNTLATLAGTDLVLDTDTPGAIESLNLHFIKDGPTIQPIRLGLSTARSSLGISRLEVSRDRRWAGIALERSRGGLDQYRFEDTGYTERYELINLATGKVVERITNLECESMPADEVPTHSVYLGPVGYPSSLAACLSVTGEQIVYATPLLTESSKPVE
ncbi:MAG: hypothetical protein ACK5TX_05885 [Planctomyces sp.]|jgi:hypothetical protein